MGLMNRKVLAKLKPGERVRPALVCSGGRTKQEFAKECDITQILKRYRVTGQMGGLLQQLQPIFADVSQIGSFAEVRQRVQAAEESFAALPADLRARFANRPESLVHFLQDPAHRAEAVKLGLLSEKVLAGSPKVQPPSVEVKSPEPPEAKKA